MAWRMGSPDKDEATSRAALIPSSHFHHLSLSLRQRAISFLPPLSSQDRVAHRSRVSRFAILTIGRPHRRALLYVVSHLPRSGHRSGMRVVSGLSDDTRAGFVDGI